MSQTQQDDTLWDTDDLATFLKVSPRSVERDRQEGRGPRFVRVCARTVRYVPSEVREWLEKQSRRSTFDVR